jgi:nucleoside-diphosphate-sugar epimerase
VGSAFARHLARLPVELIEVTRQNYQAQAGKASAIVIEAACNSKKFLADTDPVLDLDLSVAHRSRTLRDFPADVHLHISSVDVYDNLSDPDATREESPIDLARTSHYGLHKLMAEQLVRHHAKRWLIIRLAGMVGAGLRKNPVFDILNRRPLRIHPDSQYQFMSTDEVASDVWRLVEGGCQNEVFNLCGRGVISPRDIAKIAVRDLDLTCLDETQKPRIVNINIEKVSRVFEVGSTENAIRAFVAPATRETPSQL